MASHDIGSTISTIMIAANSHSTGLVQSILALGVSMLPAMVMCFQSRFLRRSMLPLPACGERVGVRGTRHGHGANGKSLSPEAFGFDLSPQAGRGKNRRRSPLSNPKQPRIARLDFVRHLFGSGRVFLHQLDVSDLAAAGLRRHLRVSRILRGEVGEKLLRLARM